MAMYHIFYDLETRFRSLAETNAWLEKLEFLYPEIPRTAAPFEDASTPRVCAAPTLEGCIEAVKAFAVFKRCVYMDMEDDGFKDYENHDEIYPIAIVELEGDFVRPTKYQVPDVDVTDEHWSLGPARVVRKELLWLGHKSVQYEERGAKSLDDYRCVAVHAVKNLEGKHHPWLDGKGHPLVCSDMGSENWSESALLQILPALRLNQGLGSVQLVTVVPEFPVTGYCTCHPVDGSGASRGRLDWCARFTGFVDRDGEPIFEKDWISPEQDFEWPPEIQQHVPDLARAGMIATFLDDAKWVGYAGLAGIEYLEFSQMQPDGHRLPGIRNNERRRLREKYPEIFGPLVKKEG